MRKSFGFNTVMKCIYKYYFIDPQKNMSKCTLKDDEM